MNQAFLWTDLTAIAFTGNDRLKWLNNLVTNDLRGLRTDSPVECFITDVKGRTLSHGLVYDLDQAIVYLSWGARQADKLLSHFDRYIIREDVQMSDISGNHTWAWEKRGVDQAGSHARGRRFLHPGLGPEWELRQSDPSSDATASESIKSEIAKRLELHRIRRKWPIINIDFDEKNLPQELDRNETAISFKKGCYLGQETVARLDALGQIQKKLVCLRLEADENFSPVRGASLTKNGVQVGEITSAIFDKSTKGWSALAFVKRGSFASGTVLECGGQQALIE
jgi:folate-binding protein YgfZ